MIIPTSILYKELDGNAVYAKMKKIIAEINARLPSYKQIKKIEIRTEPFDRTTSRKIQRYKVN